MTKQDIEGFLSDPFFVTYKTKNIEESDYEWFNERVKYAFKDNYDDRLYQNILHSYQRINRENMPSENEHQTYLVFVKQAVLDYFVQEEVLHYFCNEEDYEKIVGLISRKQINSKMVVNVLSRISIIFEAMSPDYDRLALVLTNDIKRKIIDFQNAFVIKQMGNLKSKIDSIVSGVKTKCYLEFYNEGFDYLRRPSDEFLSYVKEKYGYYLISVTYSMYVEKNLNLRKILSYALLDDDSMWSFDEYGYNEKSIVNFVALVEKFNDIKHAEKIIDYAFKEACNDEKIKFFIENKISLSLFNVEKDLINWSINRLDIYLSKVVDFQIDESELNGFIYPIYNGYDDYISKGKDIFNKFIKEVYPNDYNKVFSELSNLDFIVRDEQVVHNKKYKALTIRDVIDYHVLGYDFVDEKKKYLSIKCKDFLRDESVLSRLYYRIYIIDKYAKDISSEYIYEYLYEVLKVIESKNKLKSSYVMDTTLRDNSYNLLKDILSNYGLKIDDSFKPLYVNALLDRKYATAEEADMFAELEQFGDAIYELAVDNILFYDPNGKNCVNHQNREEFVKADAQVEVVQFLGLEKAYISKLNNALNNKYHQNEMIEAGLNVSYMNGHFLADSLEMVIGAVAKEFGIQRALDFATDIIVKAYDLEKPVLFKNFDPVYLYNESNLNKDYLNKIYPGPFLKYPDYYSSYSIISSALNKLLKIAILGNDTPDKRRLITISLGELSPGDKYDNFYQIVVSYLYFGIEQTIEKYRKIVESNYNKSLKK